jgi:peroxiredoxin
LKDGASECSANGKSYPKRGKMGSRATVKVRYENHHDRVRRRRALEGSMSVDVGSVAPDFSLPSDEGTPVSLSENRGKAVVLAFFPAAFSSVCTRELCTFRDSLGRLNDANAVVFGISVDTFFALKAFREQQHLNFHLLSDFNKTVIEQYGVVNPDMIGMKGIARRAVFVIDANGVVRYSEVLKDARNEPNYDRVMETLSAL